MRCSGIEEADSDAGQQAGTVFPLVKEGKQVPAKRLSMRKIKEVLRLKFELGLGHRQIARSCGINHGTVGDYIRRAEAAGLEWPLPGALDVADHEKPRFFEHAPTDQAVGGI